MRPIFTVITDRSALAFGLKPNRFVQPSPCKGSESESGQYKSYRMKLMPRITVDSFFVGPEPVFWLCSGVRRYPYSQQRTHSGADREAESH